MITFLHIVNVAILVFLINIPFGYWRTNERKFSFKWFLLIHAPVPLVIFLRYYSEIGFEFYTYPILIVAFFTGQFIGRKYLPVIVKSSK